MSAKIILIICSCAIGYGKAASTYDQRQTGGLNVQVDLKDLRIIALMKGGKEEYVDYDYAYDYSEMTIKPQNGTTPKPLNDTTVAHTDTIKDNSTAVVVVTEQTTLTIKNNNSESLQPAEETSYQINDTSTTIKNLEAVTTAATEMFESSSWSNKETTITPKSTTPSGCKKGFVMNQKGDCELKLQGAGNALLKLVKLSQKLKLRRENRSNEDSSST